MSNIKLSRNVPIVTVVTIIVCGVITLVFYWYQSTDPILLLFFSEQYGRSAIEIRSGEVWRLITPMFVHIDVYHLLFNMVCFAQIGTLLEHTFKSYSVLLMLFFFGVPANISEYIASGPNFGGLSAVEFGMLSFIWAYGIVNPNSHINMPLFIVVILIVYFILSWFGFFGQMSNVAHTVGLITGLFAGFLIGTNNRIRVDEISRKAKSLQ